MWSSLFIVVSITTLTLVGDYAIKVASTKTGGLASPWFVIGATLYGLPAFGWFFLMRDNSLAIIGAMYSATTMILLAGLGYFVFKEAFGWRDFLGLSLAVAAVVIMSRDKA